MVRVGVELVVEDMRSSPSHRPAAKGLDLSLDGPIQALTNTRRRPIQCLTDLLAEFPGSMGWGGRS
jgi:hypothetical protein